MDAAQQRLVLTETLIAGCLCSVLPSLLIYLSYEPFPVPLWGAEGLVAFAAKSTLVAVVLMTLLMSLGTRGKVRKGAVAPLPRGRFRWLQWVPRALPLRVPLFAVAAAATAAAGTALYVLLAAPAPLDRAAFVAYNLLLGAAIGLLMTPWIQCAALSDATAATVSPAQGAV